MEIDQNSEESSFLFNIDILVKSHTNALAIQALFEMFNESEEIIDFRIKSGMELGQVIESMLELKRKSLLSQSTTSASSDPKNKSKGNKETAASSSKKQIEHRNQLDEWINLCIQDNRLIRLTANRGGQHLSIPCRILNFDQEQQLLNVYHVDEKQVYTFKLNEIDEVA